MSVATTAAETAVKFHLSLNVTDLNRAVAFYRVLFGVGPAKHHDDYAKFELDDPPVVFSLVPRPAAPGGSLSHVGLRVADAAAIEAVRQRLEAAGIATQEQPCTTCGYARQQKCWVADPDRIFWEVYFIEEDVDPASVRRSLEGPPARVEAAPGPVVWEHYVTHPAADRIPHADASVDEVLLTGTFNAALAPDERARLVREARRVLRPGGRVVVHGLMADRPLPGTMPALPGMAALVSRVPTHAEPLQALRDAGFVGLEFTKFTPAPWFVHDGVEMREVKLVGWQPAADGTTRQVLYKGPFRQATDEAGTVYLRGQRVTVSGDTWHRLRRGAAAENFLFLDPDAPAGCAPAGGD
jgi:catechol 2,3-dioxygenase-like lactoylglutathione lyase family enzyme